MMRWEPIVSLTLLALLSGSIVWQVRDLLRLVRAPRCQTGWTETKECER